MRVVGVEFDRDRDGVYEERLAGNAAERRVRELRDESECIEWWIENIDQEGREYFKKYAKKWRAKRQI